MLTLRDRARMVLGAFRRKATEAIAPSDTRIFFGSRTQSGIRVNEDNALALSPVWSAIRLISETIASLTWGTFSRRPDGGRQFVDTPVVTLLNHQANGETTAFDFVQALSAWALSWGNGYGEIERVNGRPVALWQLPPDIVDPQRDDQGRLVYVVRSTSGNDVALPAADVLHFRGLGWDGLRGYSVITMAAQAIGLGLATETFGANFFGNGAKPGGIITLDGEANDETIKRLRESWWATHGGPGKSGRPAILEAGTSWQPESVPPEDAQFLETRKFQVLEIARFFRVPPHMIMDMDRATFSNIEHQAIEFVVHTILPWVSRFENEVDIKLLGGSGARGTRLFAKANLDVLLRGDQKSRFEAYNTARQGGWMNANEIRALEDMNPQDGDQGTVYWAPRNMVPADQFGEEPDPPALPSLPPQNNNDENNGRAGARRVLTAALRRIAAREAGMIGDYVRKHDKAESDEWVTRFFLKGRGIVAQDVGDTAVAVVESAIGPDPSLATEAAVRGIVGGWAEARAAVSASDWCNGRSVADVAKMWTEDRPAADASDLCKYLAVVIGNQAGLETCAERN